jgi:hypothetical protein
MSDGRLLRVLSCAALVRGSGVLARRYETEIADLEVELLQIRDMVVNQGINFEDAVRGCDILSPEGDQSIVYLQFSFQPNQLQTLLIFKCMIRLS